MATNIGTGPQDIPLNQFLGEQAFMDAKPKVACKVSLSTVGNHSLSSGDYFPFTRAIFEYGTQFDTLNYKFTAPYAGLYFISMNTYKNGTGTPTTFEIVRNKDTTPTVIGTSRGSNSGDVTQHCTLLEYLNDDNTISVRAASSFIAYENTTDGRYTNLSIYYLG